MLFVKKLKNNTLLVDLEKLEIGKKRKPLNFIAWKWCVILLDINDVGWPSGRGDNYPEAYRIYWSLYSETISSEDRWSTEKQGESSMRI